MAKVVFIGIAAAVIAIIALFGVQLAQPLFDLVVKPIAFEDVTGSESNCQRVADSAAVAALNAEVGGEFPHYCAIPLSPAPAEGTTEDDFRVTGSLVGYQGGFTARNEVPNYPNDLSGMPDYVTYQLRGEGGNTLYIFWGRGLMLSDGTALRDHTADGVLANATLRLNYKYLKHADNSIAGTASAPFLVIVAIIGFIIALGLIGLSIVRGR
jgi:hypothetical protein